MPLNFSQVRQTPEFVAKVKKAIEDEVSKMRGTAYHSTEGRIEGDIANYELQSDPEIENWDGEGRKWNFRFKSVGIANIQSMTPDGHYFDNEIEGPCEGSIDVEFPDDVNCSFPVATDHRHCSSLLEVANRYSPITRSIRANPFLSLQQQNHARHAPTN